MRTALTILLTAVAIAFAAPATAADLVIGYAELKRDIRYSKARLFARFQSQPAGRPHAGAAVALKEIRFHGAKLDAAFKLTRLRGRDVDDLADQVTAAHATGVGLFLVDLGDADFAALAHRTADRPLILFNISARADSLRQSECAAHILHVVPNYAMLMDGLAQYLAAKRWHRALALVGPRTGDKNLLAAFQRAAKRFGIQIVEVRDFLLGNDPRDRARNNIQLLTRAGRYDVVFVADTDGEFARDVPYQIAQPRPVVGVSGLAPAAWHWAWDRHGAPQLEKRFEKAHKRPMQDGDWAAWMAVKAIGEAVQRTGSTAFADIRAYLLSPDLILDGFKGYRSNFRPWDQQLRQPILLGTQNRVVARAPIDGFVHQVNNLDTLGFDKRDSRCGLQR